MQRVHAGAEYPVENREVTSSFLPSVKADCQQRQQRQLPAKVSEICDVYSVIELLFTKFAECKTQ